MTTLIGFTIIGIGLGSIGSVLIGLHEGKKINDEIDMFNLKLQEDQIQRRKDMDSLREQANMFSEEA